MPRKARFLSAPDAARELGITLPTLYAYVSRGLIRSEAGTGKSRARRYHAEDVARLKERKEQRQDPERSARTALHLGSPVLESAISLIEDGGLFYRGYEVVELARTRTLEQVAELVWTGELPGATVWGAERGAPLPCAFDPDHPIESFQGAIAAAGMADPGAYDLRPEPLRRTGRWILQLMVASVTREDPSGIPLALALQRTWAPQRDEARRLLDAALILCVDHELNASAFTARCAASADATPYGTVIAGLSALGGARQSGGEVERVEALFDEAGRGDVRSIVASRLRRGEGIPGFGHPLYPNGDPRGRSLLELLRSIHPDHPAVVLADRIAAAASELLGEHPVIDFGLVTLSRTYGFLRRSALAIFAIGRSAGFIGHALEQRATGRVIRPRARYTGVPRRGEDAS